MIALACIAILGVVGLGAGSARREGFSFDSLRARARAMAKADYVKRPIDDLPEWLAKLDYDGYRKLRFHLEMSLWAGDGVPFAMHFMHRGYLFRRRVPIFVIDGDAMSELRYSPQQFSFGDKPTPEISEDLGYAGLALKAHLEKPERWDEVAAFQGASYFRLVAAGQVYGASARGLAVDTAAPRGEEFPEFVEFWVVKPQPNDSALILYALLDSPSTAGAFRFLITPGAQTSALVSAYLYPRHGVGKLGLAPLTSMFLLGEARSRGIPEWRPEVHDSDGLLVAGGDGSWLWRPLNNPERSHRVTRIALENPAGFGLLQRDRSFDSYQDLESRFEARPSYWVEPKGAWGKGAVELVEIPSDVEWNDNIVAYWVPEKPPGKGEEYGLEYTVSAIGDDPVKPLLARATSTRVRPGKDAQMFVIDFNGPQLDAGEEELRADVAPARGQVRNLVLQRNGQSGGQRVSFEWVDAAPEPADIRVTLRRDKRPVSETLLLQWAKP